MINVLIRGQWCGEYNGLLSPPEKKSITVCAVNQVRSMISVESEGDRKVLGIIGDPVRQVKSPAVFNDNFQRCGTNAVMVPLHVGSNEFQKALDGLRSANNFAGAISGE